MHVWFWYIDRRTFPMHLALATCYGILVGCGLIVADWAWRERDHVLRHIEHFVLQEELASTERGTDFYERLWELIEEAEQPPYFYWFSEVDLSTIKHKCLGARYADMGKGAGPSGQRFMCLRNDRRPRPPSTTLGGLSHKT